MPYDSAIFIAVQEGDIDRTRKLFCEGLAHVNTVDPYGLSLIYVGLSTRLQTLPLTDSVCILLLLLFSRLVIGCEVFLELIRFGVNTEWRDDIGKWVCAVELGQMADSCI